jgi:hypothetical protein
MQNKGEFSEPFDDETSIAETESAKKVDREHSDDTTPRQRVKRAHPLSKPNAAGFSLFQQRPPSPEKEGHSRIERQNVDPTFSQRQAKEQNDSDKPYQRIEKMILCQALPPLVEKNRKAGKKEAPRKRILKQYGDKIVEWLIMTVAANSRKQSFIDDLPPKKTPAPL